MIPCKFCGERIKKKHLLKHLEREHFEAEPFHKSRFYLRCGDCSCCFSDEEANSMVDHCLNSGHDASKISMSFSEFIRNQSDQIRRLIIAGVDTLKDFRNSRTQLLFSKIKRNPISDYSGSNPIDPSNNDEHIETSALHVARKRKRTIEHSSKPKDLLDMTQNLSAIQREELPDNNEIPDFTKSPCKWTDDQPEKCSEPLQTLLEDDSQLDFKGRRKNKTDASLRKRAGPNEVETTSQILLPSSQTAPQVAPGPLPTIRSISPIRHDGRATPASLSLHMPKSELRETYFQRELAEVKSEAEDSERDRHTKTPTPPPQEIDLLDQALNLSNADESELYNDIRDPLTLEKIEKKNPATIPLARVSLTDNYQEFQENIKILESLPGLSEITSLENSTVDISTFGAEDPMNVSTRADFDASRLSVQDLTVQKNSARHRHINQMKRQKAPRKKAEIPYRGPEFPCTMCDFVAIGRCFSGSRVYAFTHGIMHAGIFFFQCADCGNRKTAYETMYRHVTKKLGDCRSFVSIGSEEKAQRLRDTLIKAFPTLDWAKYTKPGTTYRGVSF